MTKNRLHILFLNSWYPSRILLQNGDFIQRHAEAVALKHQVTAIHVITDKSVSKITITDNNINGVRTIIAYIPTVKSNLIKQIRFYKAYDKLISMSGYFDMVHVNRLFPVGIIALKLKIFRSIPFIISEHFTGYLKPLSDKLSKIEVFTAKQITKQADYVCPVSKNLSNSMKYLGLTGNYHPIANVVNTTIFTPKNINNKSLTLIHISNLKNDHKNVSGILKTVAKLQNYINDFTFYLIGDNPNQYKDQIDSLLIDNSKIKLIGQIPHQQVISYLQKSDILILFSNYENLPCVILEAFACGTKVISTKVGGVNEFFPNNFGELIPPKDEAKLLESIISIHNSNTFVSKSEMHQYAINNFSPEIICRKFDKLYLKSLSNKNK